MTDIFKIPKENGLSYYDGSNVLRDVHNSDNKALDVISANQLVPTRYSRLEVDYYTSGFASGEVSTVRYYSDGAKEKTILKCFGDVLGTPHKTSLLFTGVNYINLARTYFVLNDDAGSVAVFYRLDGSGNPPVNYSRVIIVDIVTGDTTQTCISKTASALNLDAQFSAIYSTDVIIVSADEYGLKPASTAGNCPIFLTNTNGAVPNRLNGKWFYINSTNDVDQYYVWFNVASGGIDPSIAGKTGLQVNLSAGASAISVAAQLKAVLESTDNFIVEQYDNEILITNKTVGSVTEANMNNSDFKSEVRIKGEARKLVATLNLQYNSKKDLISVERE
jgi:hypothetical protein